MRTKTFEAKRASLRAKFISLDTIEVCVVDEISNETWSLRWNFRQPFNTRSKESTNQVVEASCKEAD